MFASPILCLSNHWVTWQDLVQGRVIWLNLAGSNESARMRELAHGAKADTR